MSVYNAEQLVSVNVYDKYRYILYHYVPTSWCNKTPYFTDGMGTKYSAESILKEGYLIEDNIVYEKPEVRLIFSKGSNITKSFNTLDECWAYQKEVVDKYIKPEARIYG